MIDYDKVKSHEWRVFLEGIAFGEIAQFTVDSPREIDSLRAVASRVNVEGGRPYVLSVEGDNKTCRVQVFTKPRLL